MAKKSVILMLVLAALLSLTSCGLDYRYSLDENRHNQIDVVLEEDQPSHLIYQDSNYVFAGTTSLFSVDTYKTDDGYYLSYEDDVMLSWNGYRYIWYIDEYYSYASNNPLFIYNSRLHQVYFREDYDYATDVFMIENCDTEIVWNHIFHSKTSNIDFAPQMEVCVYSKQCSRIKTTLEMAFIEDQWYLCVPNSQEIWSASDEFIKILSENGLIIP